jgi:glutathione peroxidase
MSSFIRLLIQCFAICAIAVANQSFAANSDTCPVALDFKFPRLQDEVSQDLCQYKGKVILVVNTGKLLWLYFSI